MCRPWLPQRTQGSSASLPSFPARCLRKLRALKGDKGARSLLAQAAFPIVSVPFPGGEVDIDLPADLPQLD